MGYRRGRNCRRAAGALPCFAATALFLFAFVSSPVPGFQISTGKVDPSLTAMPIEVTIWVKDGVTPADEARVLAQIEQGLQMWEDVPTSEIAFEIVEVVHATNNPGGLFGQLRITVGNRADLTSGGAIIPRNDGTPGLWLGAVADNPELVGNPDNIAFYAATNFGTYDISGSRGLDGKDYEVAHRGYDTRYVEQDPDRLVPVDVLKELEDEGIVGEVHHQFFSTSGLVNPLANSRRLGREIAQKLKEAGVDAVILTST